MTDKPIIYLITEGNLSRENFAADKKRVLEIIKTAAENKISLIQLREKLLPAKLLFELAGDAAEITRHTNTRLLVNDRADIALAAGAGGVHLTENSLRTEIIRRSFPKDFLIGVSSHSPQGAKIARAQGADFVTFSPVFETPGKGRPQGLEKLTAICEQLKSFPVIGLGGIDETNYRSVLQTGAAGFAAIRFLNNTENLKMLGYKDSGS